ncbi:FeoA family protein [Mangrovibacterium lignilyticum]|uniref:FeoA family protein n=1 Tax=Mangrovibacterium lignilyticum TaxID=2668052 RepID=UPI0013D13669|nr:FeoA family protein [Mangrovibacterium lignilyticum]
MKQTIADLNRGERGVIENFSPDDIPLKFLEMGCLPGNEVSLIQMAPFRDPIYINVNGNNLAIRKELANLIEITIVK